MPWSLWDFIGLVILKCSISDFITEWLHESVPFGMNQCCWSFHCRIAMHSIWWICNIYIRNYTICFNPIYKQDIQNKITAIWGWPLLNPSKLCARRLTRLMWGHCRLLVSLQFREWPFMRKMRLRPTLWSKHPPRCRRRTHVKHYIQTTPMFQHYCGPKF